MGNEAEALSYKLQRLEFSPVASIFNPCVNKSLFCPPPLEMGPVEVLPWAEIPEATGDSFLTPGQ